MPSITAYSGKVWTHLAVLQVSKGLSAFWDVGVVHADLVTPLQVPAASLDTKPAVLTLGGVASPTSTVAASTPHTPAASPLNVAAASAAATTDADNDVDEEMGLESVESFDEASLRLQNPLATPSAQTPSLASVNNSDGSTGPTLPSLGGPGSAMANDQQEPVTPVTSTVAIGGRVHWKATLTAWWAHVRSGNAWRKLKAAHGKDMFRPFAAHSDFHAVKSLGHMAGLLGPKSRSLATSRAPPTPVELYGSPDGVAQACRTGKTVLAFDKVEEFVPSWFEVVDGFVDTYSVSKSYFAIVDLGAALLLALCAAAFTQAKVVALMALLFVTVRRQVRQLHRSAPSLPPSHWAFPDCSRIPHPCCAAQGKSQRQCPGSVPQLHQDCCQCVLLCWLRAALSYTKLLSCLAEVQLPWPSFNCWRALPVSRTSWLCC